MEPQEGDFLPSELLADDAVTPITPEDSKPAELTDADRQRIAMEFVQRNPQVFQAPVVQQQVVQAPADEDKIEYDDEGQETAASYLKRTIKDAVTTAVGQARTQWSEEFMPAQGALAAEAVYNSCVQQYKLSPGEASELRQVLKNVSPQVLARSLDSDEAKKSFASMAKGRAFFNAPPTPAPASRPSTGLQFAEGITQQDIKDYMKWQGIDKLSKVHIDSLKASGHIK